MLDRAGPVVVATALGQQPALGLIVGLFAGFRDLATKVLGLGWLGNVPRGHAAGIVLALEQTDRLVVRQVESVHEDRRRRVQCRVAPTALDGRVHHRQVRRRPGDLLMCRRADRGRHGRRRDRHGLGLRNQPGGNLGQGRVEGLEPLVGLAVFVDRRRGHDVAPVAPRVDPLAERPLRVADHDAGRRPEADVHAPRARSGHQRFGELTIDPQVRPAKGLERLDAVVGLHVDVHHHERPGPRGNTDAGVWPMRPPPADDDVVGGGILEPAGRAGGLGLRPDREHGPVAACIVECGFKEHHFRLPSVVRLVVLSRLGKLRIARAVLRRIPGHARRENLPESARFPDGDLDGVVGELLTEEHVAQGLVDGGHLGL